MFFKKLVDKAKFDIIPKTNEEYRSVTYGCIRFIESYLFLSSSLDSLLETLVDKSNGTLKNLKVEIVDNDEILKTVNKIAEENETLKDLKKDYPEEIMELEEALLNCIGEIDLNILKTKFLGKRNSLNKKLAYLYECFNSLDDYQKPVNNFKKKDFISKLENDYASDDEIERTKQIINLFNIKYGEELTQIHLKTDVLFLT